MKLHTFDDLKEAFLYEVERISIETLFKLSDFMVRRCSSVLLSRDGSIKY